MELLERLLDEGGLRSPRITVATVDGFQGNECLDTRSYNKGHVCSHDMIHFRQIGRSDLSCEWWVVHV